MTVVIGTSGWQYDDWRGAFYPERLPKKQWLEAYAESFATVEVNNSFYRLPDAKVFADWRRRTPDDFCVAVKASRYLTHIKRLRDPVEPVARLVERCRALGDKLGPVLLQLPPNLPVDLDGLRQTIEQFPPDVRLVVETRNETWNIDAVASLLADRGVCACLADAPGTVTPRWRTASFGYVRFHAGTGRPRPCYTPRALEAWAAWLADTYPATATIYAYFNNDTNACALRDASRFADAVERAGLRATRVPDAGSVHVVRPGGLRAAS